MWYEIKQKWKATGQLSVIPHPIEFIPKNVKLKNHARQHGFAGLKGIVVEFLIQGEALPVSYQLLAAPGSHETPEVAVLVSEVRGWSIAKDYVAVLVELGISVSLCGYCRQVYVLFFFLTNQQYYSYL